MVNKDILQALEQLTHKGFSEDNSIYLIKRCNVIANIKRITNKKVLVVDEMGDIIAILIKGRPKEIHYYLENIFAKYYIELKYAFALRNNYKSFTDFFVMTNKNDKLFSYNKYYEISKYLTEQTRLFWDALYENSNYDGMKIRKSELFVQKNYNLQNYITEKDYNMIRKRMPYVKLYNLSSIEGFAYDCTYISAGLKEKYCDIIKTREFQII